MPITKVILGTAQMGMDYGINNTTGQISESKAFKILTKAYESGINSLDTAEAYGNAHQLIGRFHQANPTLTFRIITKLPAHDSTIDFKKKIEQYLRDLTCDNLEVLMFHSYRSFIENQNKIQGLIQLKQEKLFHYLGVSIYSTQELQQLIDNPWVDVIQVPFNLLDNYHQKGFWLQLAKSKGKIIHTRSAFLQGLFFADSFQTFSVARQLRNELTLLKTVAKNNNLSMESLALNYCIGQPAIDRVIIGIDSMEQLERNIHCMNNSLPEEVMQQIDSINVENADLINPTTWPARPF